MQRRKHIIQNKKELHNRDRARIYLHISWLNSTKFNGNCEKHNKSNFASQGAALCRTATTSLHFESQAKFKGVNPWRQV
jgi:hypothetical protein